MKRELFFASNQTNPILKLVSSQFVPLPIRPRFFTTNSSPCFANSSPSCFGDRESNLVKTLCMKL